MKRDINTLLFDMDGTLVDYWETPLQLDFVTRTILRLRPHADWRDVITAIRRAKAELDRPSASQTNMERTLNVLSESLKMDRQKTEQILGSVMREVFPKVSRYFYPMKGALDFIDWAKPHFRMILATNPVWPEDIVKLRLAWGKIDPEIFSSITHAMKMHSIKPSLHYYQEILDQEGLTPGQCLLIGNETEMDLPARKLGIPVYLIRKNSPLKVLAQPKGTAPAWKGDYPALRKLLFSLKLSHLRGESAH